MRREASLPQRQLIVESACGTAPIEFRRQAAKPHGRKTVKPPKPSSRETAGPYRRKTVRPQNRETVKPYRRWP